MHSSIIFFVASTASKLIASDVVGIVETTKMAAGNDFAVHQTNHLFNFTTANTADLFRLKSFGLTGGTTGFSGTVDFYLYSDSSYTQQVDYELLRFNVSDGQTQFVNFSTLNNANLIKNYTYYAQVHFGAIGDIRKSSSRFFNVDTQNADDVFQKLYNGGAAWGEWRNGENLGSGISMTAVPEPGTLLLSSILASASGAGLWLRRKQRKIAKFNA